MNDELYTQSLAVFNKARSSLVDSLHRNFPTFVPNRLPNEIIKDYEIKSQLDSFIEDSSARIIELNDYIDAAIIAGGKEGSVAAYERAVDMLKKSTTAMLQPLEMLDNPKLSLSDKKEYIMTSFENILDNLPSVQHLMGQYRQERGVFGRNQML